MIILWWWLILIQESKKYSLLEICYLPGAQYKSQNLKTLKFNIFHTLWEYFRADSLAEGASGKGVTMTSRFNSWLHVSMGWRDKEGKRFGIWNPLKTGQFKVFIVPSLLSSFVILKKNRDFSLDINTLVSFYQIALEASCGNQTRIIVIVCTFEHTVLYPGLYHFLIVSV